MVRMRRSGWVGSSVWICLLIALGLLAGFSCQKRQVSPAPAEQPVDFPQFDVVQVTHPAWSHNASIYEVNVRQFSPGGTFAEFEEHLPRLKDLGVDILWFMPIHPIGEAQRKGTLGSYYSVKDYYGVNPEFGTLEEFRALVEKIHDMGMYVLIDWVANHSAWDNDLTRTNPDWYIRDVQGNFVPPVADWSDVIDLNYNVPGLWYYMAGAMRFWVEDVGIDGFRCDVAGMVPLEFWNYLRVELDKVKPVFILAEWEAPEAHDFAFDMTYAWGLHHLMAKISKGMAPASGVGAYLTEDARRYPRSAYRMNFTSNHDENSWNGTVYERMGDAAVAMAVLAATLPGMPLVYSGQEAGLDHRLEFFEKDEIKWHQHTLTDLYAGLLNLKKSNRALWNGDMGGDLTWIHTTNDAGVFAFLREKEGDRVFVILNLSGYQQIVTLDGDAHHDDYRDAFDNEPVALDDLTSFTLDPWEYKVLAATTPGRGLLPFRPSDGARAMLATWMTGSFSSAEQASADSNYLDIRLEMHPIWKDLDDGYWLYVEQAVATHLDQPYRQRVYKLSAQADGSIRSDVYTIPDPVRFVGVWKESDRLGELMPDDLMIKPGCEVILRRMAGAGFEGGTVGTGCFSELRGAAYAISEVKVNSEGIESWDRGFDSDGNQVWGAEHGGYVFKKTKVTR